MENEVVGVDEFWEYCRGRGKKRAKVQGKGITVSMITFSIEILGKNTIASYISLKTNLNDINW